MEKNTTYDTKLDDNNLQIICARPMQAGTETTALWNSQHNEQYYRFDVMPRESGECGDLEHGTDSVADYSTVTCHICNIKVPTKYIKEHKNSEKHEICMKIIDTALQRTKNNLLKDTLSPQTGSVAGYFCKPCSVIVTNENHETSPIHKSSLLHDKLLKDLIMIYSDKNNINNIYLKYLTDFTNNDIEKNSSVKCSTECQNNYLIGDNINNELNSENKDTGDSDKMKYPKDYTTKDFTNNELKCSNDSGNKDVASNKTGFASEFKIEGPESNNIKYLTEHKDKCLEKQITYATDWEKTYIENDVKIKSKGIKKEHVMDDPIKEQIVYKHTKIITDLNSMESYFKILMEIFSQTSLIYVYINRLVVGINIGEFKLKVHVDSFLGINGESNMCLLCSSKFTDREEHIYNFDHMKKVMAPIEDHHCIRQINEISFYCLLCACLIVSNDKYPENVENIREKVTAHVESEKHNTNFNRALHYEAFKSGQVDLKFTSKSFFDEHICNVCGLFVSKTAIKDRNNGNINNSKYREHFCPKSRVCRLKAYNSEIYDYALHPTHAIKTYCGACDLYVDTRYLKIHTTGKKHKEKIACNAHLRELAHTKVDVQKAVFSDRSERHVSHIASEVLEDLLWAQMEISKTPKEVICKVCNIVVPKALKDVQIHIKGENHQKKFANLLLSCNTNIVTYTGLEQMYLQTEVKAKVKCVKCEICNISIPNTHKVIDVHVNGICHQNKLNKGLLVCNVMEKNKSQAKTDNQANRCMKAVNIPSSNIEYAAVTENKGKTIPIKDPNKTNTKTNKKDKGPVEAQSDANQISRIDNSERIVAKPPYRIPNTTNYMNPSSATVTSTKVQSIQGLNKRNRNVNKNNKVRVLRPPVNLEKDPGPMNAQVDESQFIILERNMNSERMAQNIMQSTTNEDPQIKLCNKNMKRVNKTRYLIKKDSHLKQNHCIVCKINFPFSDSDVADHLLGNEHEKKYRFLLSSNHITKQKTGHSKSKFRCNICSYDILNEMCALVHIEAMIHQDKINQCNPSNSRSNMETHLM